jgi:hypothetical protein
LLASAILWVSSRFFIAAPRSLAASNNFASQTVHHGIFTASAGRIDNPTDGQRQGALIADFDGHLIRRTTDAAGANLDLRGRNFFKGVMEDAQTPALTAIASSRSDLRGLHVPRALSSLFSFADFFSRDSMRAVNDFFGYGFFPLYITHVDEFRQDQVPERGSGRISLLSALRRRDMCFLLT